jgi:hypothetical protein
MGKEKEGGGKGRKCLLMKKVGCERKVEKTRCARSHRLWCHGQYGECKFL